jgi:hypothetical protein
VCALVVEEEEGGRKTQSDTMTRNFLSGNNEQRSEYILYCDFLSSSRARVLSFRFQLCIFLSIFRDHELRKSLISFFHSLFLCPFHSFRNVLLFSNSSDLYFLSKLNRHYHFWNARFSYWMKIKGKISLLKIYDEQFFLKLCI